MVARMQLRLLWRAFSEVEIDCAPEAPCWVREIALQDAGLHQDADENVAPRTATLYAADKASMKYRTFCLGVATREVNAVDYIAFVPFSEEPDPPAEGGAVAQRF